MGKNRKVEITIDEEYVDLILDYYKVDKETEEEEVIELYLRLYTRVRTLQALDHYAKTRI